MYFRDHWNAMFCVQVVLIQHDYIFGTTGPALKFVVWLVRVRFFTEKNPRCHTRGMGSTFRSFIYLKRYEVIKFLAGNFHEFLV